MSVIDRLKKSLKMDKRKDVITKALNLLNLVVHAQEHGYSLRFVNKEPGKPDRELTIVPGAIDAGEFPDNVVDGFVGGDVDGFMAK